MYFTDNSTLTDPLMAMLPHCNLLNVKLDYTYNIYTDKNV